MDRTARFWDRLAERYSKQPIADEAAYQITRAIFENLAALREIHKATREVTLEKALAALGAPLHPGAARYYREQGIEIPPELLPPGAGTQ